MGKRGPAKEPTAIHVLKGGKKDESEPVPDPDRPIIAPDWLTAEALEVWDEYAPQLKGQRVLTSWDLEQFAAWCDAAVRRRVAVRMLEEEGEVILADVFDRNGKPTGKRRQRNEWLFVWKDASAVCAQIGARFGLTPADRTGVKRDGGKQDNGGKGRLLA